MARKKISEAMRSLVAERATGCCEYCLGQEKFATHRFSIDHVVPVEKGGGTDLENLALACQGCNNLKYARIEAVDPDTNTIVPLYNPRQESWHDHFQWNENYTVILGISPIGRATVQLLKLNREMLVNQRVVYRAFGVHPPNK